jgi:hypothetical protein
MGGPLHEIGVIQRLRRGPHKAYDTPQKNVEVGKNSTRRPVGDAPLNGF